MPLEEGPLPSLAADHETTGLALVGGGHADRPRRRRRARVDDHRAQRGRGRVARAVEGHDGVHVGARDHRRVPVGVRGRGGRRDQRPVAVHAIAAEQRAARVGRRRPRQRRVDRGRSRGRQRRRARVVRVVDDDLRGRGGAGVAGLVDRLDRVRLARDDRRRVGVGETGQRARVDLGPAAKHVVVVDAAERVVEAVHVSTGGDAVGVVPFSVPERSARRCRRSRSRSCSPCRRCPRRRRP